MWRVLLLLLPALAAACNDGRPLAVDAGPDAAPPTALALLPAAHRFVVENGATEALRFRAIATFADGRTRDVTDDATFAVDDPALVTFADPRGTATPLATAAGPTVVRATFGGFDASADVDVVQRALVVGSGAPADAPALFDAATLDPAAGPAIFYPGDGALVPPNFVGLHVQFLRGQDDLFLLAVETPWLEYHEIAACTAYGNPCVMAPDAKAWEFLGRMAGLDATWTITGTRALAPATKRASAPRTLRFTSEPLAGALSWTRGYAWEFVRMRLDDPEVEPAPWMTDLATQVVFMHGYSPDGALVAFGRADNSSDTWALEVRDVATGVPLWTDPAGAMHVAWSPDGTQLLATNDAGLERFDAASGALLGDVPGALMAARLGWQPSGGAIVYATSAPPAADGGELWTVHGSLQLAAWDGAFSAPQVLVPFAGDNNFDPAFLTDEWIAFARLPGDGSSEQDQQASLWAVAASGGAPFPLAGANAGTTGSSWPVVASRVTYAGGEATLFFFTSRRPIGVLTPHGTQPQIWLSAFDPARLAAGLDPSFAPLYVPRQGTGAANRYPAWSP